MTSVPTAAVLLIGDEILSGRTKDKNLGFIADYLVGLGIDLKEARCVADDEGDIVAALNALRARYTYVFTTGGIGPTHDDITADAVAKAFQVPIGHHPRALEILLSYFKEIGREPNEARLRMARTPEGATLIENAVSKAPGFRIGNVFVMAGVPKIMQAMMEAVAPDAGQGRAHAIAHRGPAGWRGRCGQAIGRNPGAVMPMSSLAPIPLKGWEDLQPIWLCVHAFRQSLEKAEAEVRALAETMTREGKARGWS